MTLLFQLIMICSIWVLGLTIVTQPGMGLYFIRKWAAAKGSWSEPLITCEWCMPSVHSLVAYAFAVGIGLIQDFSPRLLVILPLVIMGSSLVVGLTWSLYKMIASKTRYYDDLDYEEYFDDGDGGDDDPCGNQFDRLMDIKNKRDAAEKKAANN